MKSVGATKIASEITRLGDMKGKAMKADAKVWLGPREFYKARRAASFSALPWRPLVR